MNPLNHTYGTTERCDMEVESTLEDNPDSISLSKGDLDRLYTPWRASVIIKVFGRWTPHTYLLWMPSEPLNLIDLGNDFHVVKFTNQENTNKVLHEGAWFIAGNFVSVWKWEPNFVPQSSTISHTAMWARLPQLPTKFYDKAILERLGQKLGALLKIDACTSATIRGRLARIYIQVPLNSPLKSEISIGTYPQKVPLPEIWTLRANCPHLLYKNINHDQGPYSYEKF